MPQHCTVHDPGLRCGRPRDSRIVVVVTVVLAVIVTNLSVCALRSTDASVSRSDSFTDRSAPSLALEDFAAEENDLAIYVDDRPFGTEGSETAGHARINGTGPLPTENRYARGPPGDTVFLPTTLG